MRILIVGQEHGKQHQNILGRHCVALVNSIAEVAIQTYDAVLISASNENKYQVARFALTNKKHVLIDAPLWGNNLTQLDELEQIAQTNKVVLQISKRYRDISQFVMIQNLLKEKKLGAIKHCRLAYVADVQHKRDGVILDLMPHLLDLLGFWFGYTIMQSNFNIMHKDALGDHAILADFYTDFSIELAANFWGQTNTVFVELFGSKDSLYLSCEHTFPVITQHEFSRFAELCNKPVHAACTFDKWIYAELHRVANEQTLLA